MKGCASPDDPGLLDYWAKREDSRNTRIRRSKVTLKTLLAELDAMSSVMRKYHALFLEGKGAVTPHLLRFLTHRASGSGFAFNAINHDSFA